CIAINVCRMIVTKNWLFLVLFLSLLTSCSNDEAAITDLFQNYKSALVAKDYSVLCSSLDNKSIQLFKDLARFARLADSLELSKTPIFVRYEVLLLRQQLIREELLDLNWEDVCKIGTDKIVLNENLYNSQLGVNKIKDNQAVYYLVINGKQTENALYFRKEESGWKLNAAKYYAMMSRMSYVEGIANGNKALQNQRLEQKVAFQADAPLKPYIWLPPSEWE
ncbi:MAG: hypothetical protein AAFY48_09620, partial [Bacteroidota bacterium]